MFMLIYVRMKKSRIMDKVLTVKIDFKGKPEAIYVRVVLLLIEEDKVLLIVMKR